MIEGRTKPEDFKCRSLFKLKLSKSSIIKSVHCNAQTLKILHSKLARPNNMCFTLFPCSVFIPASLWYFTYISLLKSTLDPMKSAMKVRKILTHKRNQQNYVILFAMHNVCFICRKICQSRIEFIPTQVNKIVSWRVSRSLNENVFNNNPIKTSFKKKPHSCEVIPHFANQFNTPLHSLHQQQTSYVNRIT